MTQVRKPGGHGEVASIMFFSLLNHSKGLSSMLYKSSKNAFHYPSNFILCLDML